MALLYSHSQTGCAESLDDVTAKDPFLKNADLMTLTFSHLQPELEARQCLLNAALRCKNFLEVALDALWGKFVFLGASTATVAHSTARRRGIRMCKFPCFQYELMLSLGP